jgi:hypothetical protein
MFERVHSDPPIFLTRISFVPTCPGTTSPKSSVAGLTLISQVGGNIGVRQPHPASNQAMLTNRATPFAAMAGIIA